MTGCCVPGCNNSNRKGFLMRNFPSNPDRKKQWIASIGRPNWTPSMHSRICEIHFTKDMWEKERCDGKRKLKYNAVPVISSSVPHIVSVPEDIPVPQDVFVPQDISVLQDISVPQDVSVSQDIPVLSENYNKNNVINMLIASMTNEGNVKINYQYQLHSNNIKQLNDKQPEDLLSMFTNVKEEIDWKKRCQELKQLLVKSKNDGCIHVPIENQRIVQPYNALGEMGNTMNKHASNEIHDKNHFSWNEKAVFLMLEEYKKRAERFRNPENKKKQLWQEISDEMIKYGYKVKADAINKKFRNLKMRYLIIKNSDKKKISRSGRMSWIYFDIMSEIVFADSSVNSNLAMASAVFFNNDNGNDNTQNEIEKITRFENSISKNLSDRKIENVLSVASTSSSTISISSILKKNLRNKKFRKRNKPIDNYRKRYMEIEEEQIKELRKIREAIEKNNKIQKERVEILKQYSLIQRGNLNNIFYYCS
ncbi:PREDICTED: protein PFC0760c-like [Atta cephalotes]|uniref:THAP-type domain-containing protein n=1 Tax=Atta cephalotes TaxID=12957 RepID=A0A158NHX6_ATTCE|nr:PREDICTED: protein PFC0760c-like [Atta cephalotes]